MAGNGNEFLPNYVEHLVPLQENRLILPRKLGLIALAVALVLAMGCSTPGFSILHHLLEPAQTHIH